MMSSEHYRSLNFPSVSDNEMLNNILNVSPKLSVQAQSSSIVMSENTVAASVVSIPSNHTPAKSSDALKKEIATLESEILHLERYLLSLYRTAYEEHLPATSNVSKNELPSQVVANQPHDNLKPCIESSSSLYVDQTTPAHGSANSDDQSCSLSLHSTSTRDQKNADSARRSLADHLGASCLLDSFNTPDRLSEDILKYISSIYCRLATPPHCQGGSFSSPPSFSSSSIFSSRNPFDNWSPQYSEDAVVHQQVLKEEVGPYASMVEVLKICFDDDSFNYASVMLKNLRSLIWSLEKVDPMKMKREEKLAFWINIHNALIMHAYLAYGTRSSSIKGASISKATYNVGGHCITACTIQSSIFGIQSHYSEPWLQTLFSPGRKLKTKTTKHVYALEYPEPLVHFALCTGTSSDPAVRVYTAKNIFRELKLAKEEFIQVSVYIDKDKKIFLPKLLSNFAKDMAMDVCGLLEAISGCLPEAQQICMRKCMRGKVDKSVQWLPENSLFRYVIHRELAKER